MPLKVPTDEGKRRYEPDGLYEGTPCTCTDDCAHACRGECGCDACAECYSDFLSCDFD